MNKQNGSYRQNRHQLLSAVFVFIMDPNTWDSIVEKVSALERPSTCRYRRRLFIDFIASVCVGTGSLMSFGKHLGLFDLPITSIALFSWPVMLAHTRTVTRSFAFLPPDNCCPLKQCPRSRLKVMPCLCFHLFSQPSDGVNSMPNSDASMEAFSRKAGPDSRAPCAGTRWRKHHQHQGFCIHVVSSSQHCQ